jgi:hypothetical protein
MPQPTPGGDGGGVPGARPGAAPGEFQGGVADGPGVRGGVAGKHGGGPSLFVEGDAAIGRRRRSGESTGPSRAEGRETPAQALSPPDGSPASSQSGFATSGLGPQDVPFVSGMRLRYASLLGPLQHSPGSPKAHPGSRTPPSPEPQRGSTTGPSRPSPGERRVGPGKPRWGAPEERETETRWRPVVPRVRLRRPWAVLCNAVGVRVATGSRSWFHEPGGVRREVSLRVSLSSRRETTGPIRITGDPGRGARRPSRRRS